MEKGTGNNSKNDTPRFQLIGIRILKGCDPEIRKVLKEGTTYFFVDGYKDADGDKIEAVNENSNDAFNELYDVKKKNGNLHINISAIVGKNGCGKSTLLEVLLRVLNNLACQFGFKEKHGSLRAVNKPIKACVYYLYDKEVITIKCDGKEIELFFPSDKAKSAFSDRFKEFFYSIVINYSLYAYNENLFVDETEKEEKKADKEEDEQEHYEEKSWISALFHKNDSYQTPVNITPMRNDGIIDINEENRLSRQRLMALYTYAGDDKNARIINDSTKNDDQIAIGFACSLEDESKLWRKCIDEYFKNNRTSYIGGFGSFKKLMPTYDPNVFKKLNKKNSITENAREYVNLINYYKEVSEELKGLINVMGENKRHYQYKYAERTDLKEFLSDLNTLHSYKHNGKSDILGIGKIPKSCPGFAWMNLSQVIRLCIIMTIWEKLKTLKWINEDANLGDDILKSKEGNNEDSQLAARLYLVYKIIHIIETYYKDVTISEFSKNKVGDFFSLKSDIETIIDEKIKDKDDYTTLKLRQTINYLQNSNLWLENAYIDNPFKDKEGKIILVKKRYIGFDSLKEKIESIESIPRSDKGKIQLQEITKFLPPPIFDGEIVISHKGEHYGLSSLSSGETQRLFTISSILYHLRNLDFKQTDKNQYKNVSLVFDETEQYFHPEYQRTFVDYLLRQLENASFEELENINILLVTHSPFMLSDIPQNHILYLENGVKDEKKHRRTFGSNINDLLHDSFYLDQGFVGKFAGKIINDLAQYLDNIKTLKVPELKGCNIVWTKEKAKAVIEMLGEPILTIKFLEMYKEAFSENDSSQNKWIEEQCNKLMGKNNEKNTNN